MALVDIGNSRMVPDDGGGWYWMKWANGNWEPVEVQAAKEGKGATILRVWYSIPVTHPYVRWGPQISPPEK